MTQGGGGTKLTGGCVRGNPDIRLTLTVVLVTTERSSYLQWVTGKHNGFHVLYIRDICTRDHRLDVEKTANEQQDRRVSAMMMMNKLWTMSTVVEMAVMLVIVSTVTTSPVPVHPGRLRVGRPCSGRHAVEQVELPSTSGNASRVYSRHHLRRSLRSVTSHLAALYDRVSRLKADYVRIDLYFVIYLICSFVAIFSLHYVNLLSRCNTGKSSYCWEPARCSCNQIMHTIRLVLAKAYLQRYVCLDAVRGWHNLMTSNEMQ